MKPIITIQLDDSDHVVCESELPIPEVVMWLEATKMALILKNQEVPDEPQST